MPVLPIYKVRDAKQRMREIEKDKKKYKKRDRVSQGRSLQNKLFCNWNSVFASLDQIKACDKRGERQSLVYSLFGIYMAYNMSKKS